MYKRIIVLATLIALGMCVGAALPQAPKPPAVPTISDALKAQFFKAQSLKMQADSQADAAQKALTKSVDDLRKVCGDGFQLQMSEQLDPVCAVKPKETKPNAK